MAKKITVNDPGKLAVLALVEICATVLLALGRITDGEWQTITVGVLAYMYGNGRLARKGAPPAPMLGPKPEAADFPPHAGISPSPAPAGLGASETTIPAPPPGQPTNPTVADWLKP